MSSIHQIYCTHCTHGSSALERGEGDQAERVLGYSARAASVEGDQLRQYYAQIEPYLYYHLPRDTPDEEKLRLTAAAAPRRMFFVPSAGGLQVAGQVCHRQTDCEGRPGSYFAHVLVQEEKDSHPPWTALDWLRLWSAPGWVLEDGGGLPFVLPALESPSELLGGTPPVIDDSLLVSFLRDPGDAPSLQAPACPIPERWKAVDPPQRRRWFTEALSQYMRLEVDKGQPLWIVVEPAVAALWFYGMARLLPDGPIRTEIGFSTLETDPERAKGSLLATWCHDPQDAAARAAVLRLPGLVVNTLREPHSEKPPAALKYAAGMVKRLLEQGCEAVDRELGTFSPLGIKRTQQLESLLAVDEVVTPLLETGSFADESWRAKPQLTQYVRLELGRRLAAMEDLKQGLATVAGGPAYLAAMDLLTAKPPVPGTRKAVVHLLKAIPPSKILGLLRVAGVSDEDKVTVLIRHVHAHGDLPPGCGFMWEEFASTSEASRHAGAVLMARVVARLSAPDLKKFFQSAPKGTGPGFLLSLLRMHQHKKVPAGSVSAVIQAMDEEAVVTLLRTRGPEFLRGYPKREHAMGEKLAALLRSLPRHPEQFKERLDLILAGQHILPDEQYQKAATAWDTCCKKISDVSRLQKPEAGANPQRRMTLLIAACRDLAMAADQAMSVDMMDAEYTWTQKRDVLLRISQEVLAGTPLLLPGPWEHEVLLQRIGLQFQHHRWPMEPLKKETPGKKEPSKRLVGPEEKSLASTSGWVFVGVMVLVLALTAGVVFAVYKMFFSGGGGTDQKRRPKKSKSRRSTVPPALLTQRPLVRSAMSDPVQRRLVSQAAEANLTAAIITSIPGLASRWRANREACGLEFQGEPRVAVLPLSQQDFNKTSEV